MVPESIELSGREHRLASRMVVCMVAICLRRCRDESMRFMPSARNPSILGLASSDQLAPAQPSHVQSESIR
jgi:hypothetical protein